MNKNVSLIDAVSSSAVQFTEIDYVIVISLMIISLTIGAFTAFSHSGGLTMDDFLFGSFKMKIIPVALSLLARFVCVVLLRKILEFGLLEFPF